MFRQTLAIAALGMMTTAVYAADPATQPSREADPTTQPSKENDPGAASITVTGVDGTIKLPDGREMKLKDLQGAGGHMSAVMVMRQAGPDGTTTEGTDEAGRKFTIKETEDEITVTIQEGDNKPVEYKAKNAEELEKNHPEAFEIYEQHGNTGGIMMFTPGGAAGGGMHQDMRIRIGEGGFHGMPGGMKIAKLGASFSPVFDEFVKSQLGEGVWVSKIAKDSRAEKVGLQQFDMIKTINGNFIESMEDLKNNTADDAKKLTVEIIRAGKPVTLEEK